jgi:hypothetical protein
MNNSIYSCTVVLGNLSTLETDEMKDNIIHFLKSFNYTDSEPEKVYEVDGSALYHYEIDIQYRHYSKIHIQRFAESLIAFCLFHRMALYEHFLD